MAIDREKLLQVQEVVDEINRYKWLESEMVGYDIGFEKAADDWFKKYASSWVSFNLPEAGKKGSKDKKSKKLAFLL